MKKVNFDLPNSAMRNKSQIGIVREIVYLPTYLTSSERTQVSRKVRGVDFYHSSEISEKEDTS